MQNVIWQKCQSELMNPQNHPESDDSLTVQEIKVRIVKEFLDLIILIELRNDEGLSGYDLVVTLNQKFALALSPGTVYAALYAMERKGFVKSEKVAKKTSFSLAPKGQKRIEKFKESREDLTAFMECIFPIVFHP
ncbi:MAG: PadR family transcriptional regulator [Candidatus Bathyarchaeota archaeon]|nr:PadR family transcriptional regulator [Candidatus Bathyarchaeota archaeon]